MLLSAAHMCGIAGIVAYDPRARPVDLDELRTIRDAMQRRGPDGAGEWLSSDGRVALAHRRLSIIDLSDRAAQPMHSADGRFSITFNGEIYNYQVLRRQLEREGRVFRTSSDTEVLLHLYELHGGAMLQQLRGMYAFGIWDAKRRELFLARDPYGIKPLYYAAHGGTLRFASQVKALMAGQSLPSELEPAAQVGVLLFGHVPEPFTLRKAVRALPAGHCMYVDERGARPPVQHFSVAEAWAHAEQHAFKVSPRDLHEALRPALRDSVHHHMVADVPVGAFLSAGIDSGALVGLMSETAKQPVRTLTLGFSEFTGRAEDETPLAAQVAAHYGTEHHHRHVTQRELEQDLPAILDAMDQPSIDGINSWFVSKATHELGLKVAISGLGGDELLGGYPSFHDLPRWVSLLAAQQRVPQLGRRFRDVAAAALRLRDGLSPKLASLLEYGGNYSGAYLLRRGLFMPWELPEVLPEDVITHGLATLAPLTHIESRLQPDPHGSYARVAALEASLYMRNQLLRDTDWASMAWSLEVRVPLVDSVLLTSVAHMLVHSTPGEGKQALAKVPLKPLPAAVATRAKTGFTTPIARWIEQSRTFTRWRDVPALRRQGCHWSRRLAWELVASG
jgi:asparagine synthase (glutamine-hydrolysing)